MAGKDRSTLSHAVNVGTNVAYLFPAYLMLQQGEWWMGLLGVVIVSVALSSALYHGMGEKRHGLWHKMDIWSIYAALALCTGLSAGILVGSMDAGGLLGVLSGGILCALRRRVDSFYVAPGLVLASMTLLLIEGADVWWAVALGASGLFAGGVNALSEIQHDKHDHYSADLAHGLWHITSAIVLYQIVDAVRALWIY